MSFANLTGARKLALRGWSTTDRGHYANERLDRPGAAMTAHTMHKQVKYVRYTPDNHWPADHSCLNCGAPVELTEAGIWVHLDDRPEHTQATLF